MDVPLDNAATYCERKVSGSVAPGEGVVSYYVEFDVDGDGTYRNAITYRDYLTLNATIACVAECENVSGVQTLQNAVATATAANETATSELYSSETRVAN